MLIRLSGGSGREVGSWSFQEGETELGELSLYHRVLGMSIRAEGDNGGAQSEDSNSSPKDTGQPISTTFPT